MPPEAGPTGRCWGGKLPASGALPLPTDAAWGMTLTQIMAGGNTPVTATTSPCFFSSFTSMYLSVGELRARTCRARAHTHQAAPGTAAPSLAACRAGHGPLPC